MNTVSGTVVTQQAGGGNAWTNDTQAKIEDSNYADVALFGSDASDYLNTEPYGGLAALPSRAIIPVIEVQVLLYADVGDISMISEMYLTESGVIQTGVRDAGKPIQTSPGWGDKGSYCGSATDLWDISAASMKSLIQQKHFGVLFLVSEFTGSPVNIFVDDTRINVFYTIPLRVRCLAGCGR